MVIAKKWVLEEAFHGEPNAANFRLEEEELTDTLKDGEVLIEGIYHSVDPYMRAHRPEAGKVILGTQVAKVLASKNKDYAVGSTVVADVGWRTKTIVSDETLLRATPPIDKVSPSTFLGVLGMPGMTAYFGFLEICAPKSGDVVLVNGAAGAVGSIVGQIAKIKGCTVIGFAGTTTKCEWIKELGFDHAFNYKEVDINKTLKTVAPDGIDCYFDNVGGDFTTIALDHMKTFGRIAFCGSISVYNEKELPKVTMPWFKFVLKQLKAEGFIVYTWLSRWPEGFKDMEQWMTEGKIKTRETVTEGFERMPEAFMSMLKGGNIGKAVVKA